MNILITGAGGFLGTYLIPLLCGQGHKLYLLSRPESIDKVNSKFTSYLDQIKVIEGDLTDPEIFAKYKVLKEIRNNVDCVIHAAAKYDLEASRAENFIHNVVGTQNILHFISKTKRKVDFHYVSTIAVAGNHKGVLLESELNKGQQFKDSYSATKFEAELAVRNHQHLMNSLSIYRLGILIGDSKKGEFEKIDGPYYFLRTLSKLNSLMSFNKLKKIPFPFNSKTNFPIIPVDYAAHYMSTNILNTKTKRMSCFHVIGQNSPSLGEFVSDAFLYLGTNAKAYPIPENPLNKYIFKLTGLPEELIQHAYSKIKYDQSEAQNLGLEVGRSSYPDFKDVFFKSAYKRFNQKRGA